MSNPQQIRASTKRISVKRKAEKEIRELLQAAAPLRTSNPNLVIEKMRKAEDIAFQFEIDELMPQILLLYGAASVHVTKVLQSIKILKRACKLAKRQGKVRLECLARLNLGIAYFESGDYKRALTSYHKCLQLQKQYGPYQNLAAVFFNIGNVFIVLRKFKKADVFLEHAKNLIDEKSQTLGYYCWLDSSGHCAFHRGKTDQAQRYFERAIGAAKKIKFNVGRYNTTTNLAHLRALLGELDESEELLSKAILFYEKKGHTAYLMEALVVLANVKYLQQKYDESLALLQKVENTDTVPKRPEIIRDAYVLFCKNFDILRKTGKYYSYKEKLKTVDEAIAKKCKAIKKIDQKIKYTIAFLGIRSQYNKGAHKELKAISGPLSSISELLDQQLVPNIERIGKKAEAAFGEVDSEEMDAINHRLGSVRLGFSALNKALNDTIRYVETESSSSYFDAVDGNRLIQDVLKSLEHEISRRNVDISIGKLPVINGIRKELFQLFRSIIENGLTFNTSPMPVISISSVNTSEGNTISIRDNGIGIKEEHKDSVFDIAFDAHTGTPFESKGIGLAASKKIVQKHRGEIWFESVPGKGTTFFIYFPGN